MGLRWCAFAFVTAACFAAKNPATVDSVIKVPIGVAGHTIPNITWAPDGDRFVFSDRGVLSLYEVKTGRQREIITTGKLDAAAVKVPAAQLFDWTNRRVGESLVQWFADGKRLLVMASGDLFVVDVAKGSFDALTQTSEAERDAKLSPDNRYVSFRRGPDLYTIEVASKQVARLTDSGSETLLNGQLDWVYPEELNLETAHWWSPDSRSIAYLQFDIGREPAYPQVSLLHGPGVMEAERYPKAGDPNAEVRLGVVPAGGGATKWMDLGEPRGFLLARVAWSPNSGEVMAERLNRVQNRLDLLMADAKTGASRVVLHEEDPYWLNVTDGPAFLDTSRFLWTSERSGFRHLYIYGVDGKLQKQLTSGDWEVDHPVRAGDTVYFMSSEDSPVERQLYAVGIDGSGKRRVTSGSGTHAVSVSPGGEYFVDDFSSVSERPRTTIYKTNGSLVRVFREPEVNADEPEILPTEIVKVKTADGTLLYARMIKPIGYQAGVRYPAVVTVYGGPGVQTIHNAWAGLTWDQVLAQKGFLIWQMDNRGSMGRGHAFETPIFHNLGKQELADQREGIDYLVKQGLVDPTRIGLYGWSYGGYMTLYTVVNAPGLIRAAIAGAPVTNWRNYDSIYTERYMGLPEENADGYKASSPQTNAKNMGDTKLLILHNVEDDNVLFQNSLQMADALEGADKRFFMLVYGQKSHGVTGEAKRQMLDQSTDFFVENLR